MVVKSELAQNVGKLVDVIGPANMDHYCKSPDGKDEFHWECKTLGPGMYGWDVNFTITSAPTGSKIAFKDTDLWPIRDPGEDAVDEMVQLVGNATARTA